MLVALTLIADEQLQLGRLDVAHPAATPSQHAILEPPASPTPTVTSPGSPPRPSSSAAPQASSTPVHPMVTRGKAGISKPNPKPNPRYPMVTRGKTATAPSTSRRRPRCCPSPRRYARHSKTRTGRPRCYLSTMHCRPTTPRCPRNARAELK
jgi:hypothetical protein